MAMALGLSAVICSGFLGFFVSQGIGNNHVRNQYKARAKRRIKAEQKLRVYQNHNLSCSIIECLTRGEIGDYFSGVTMVQMRMRELCGLKSAVLELPQCSYETHEWQRLSGLISLVSSLCFGSIVCAIFRIFLFGLAGSFCVFFLIPTCYRSLSQRMKNKKRREYERSLPEMLNVIVLSVQAGATFDTAFEAYASKFKSALASQVKATYELYISQVKSRSDALDMMAREVDSEPFYRFVATVKRALYLGSPLGIALENQLRDIREYREEKIKEEIAKKPVQILLPLGVFILPGMLILLLGPILMEVMQGISMR